MKKEIEKQKKSSYVEGVLSLFSIYTNNSREVEKVFIDREKDFEGDRKFKKLLSLMKKNNTPFEYCDKIFFEENTVGSTHGGIVALVGEKKMMGLEEMFEKSNGFIALLEGIEDPYNFGYSVRALFAAGADALILLPRNWLSAAGVCVRASAGTTEQINCALCDDYDKLKELCVKHGYSIVCAVESSEESVPIFKSKLKKPLVLAIGGEKRGISSSLLNHCDSKITIEYANPNFKNALTTASAASIIGFEIMRQSRDN